MDKLEPRVLAGNAGRNEVSGLTTTGIPPHVLIANEMVKVRSEMEDMKTDIMSRIEDLPEKVRDTLLENFSVRGVLPITVSTVNSMISDLKETYKSISMISMQ